MQQTEQVRHFNTAEVSRRLGEYKSGYEFIDEYCHFLANVLGGGLKSPSGIMTLVTDSLSMIETHVPMDKTHVLARLQSHYDKIQMEIPRILRQFFPQTIADEVVQLLSVHSRD